MNQLAIRKIDDLHGHFRLRPTLDLVLRHLVPYCSRGIVMPNLKKPVQNGEHVTWYRNQFTNALAELPTGTQFEPLMTIAIQDSTTPADIISAHEAGAVAGKIYPLGVTTNSENGLRDFFSRNMLSVYNAMRETGMLLLIHGELEGEKLLATKREDYFIDKVFLRLVELLDDQRIVLEHISTQTAVDEIKAMDPTKVGATITAHHLWWTLNDVIGDGCHPHKVIMPTLKDYDDRDALVAAATSGDPHFFFGSDNAPHPVNQKECGHGKCGAFTAPHALSMLAEVFEKAGALDQLEDFTSTFGAMFYGLPLNTGTVTIERKVWEVPSHYGSDTDPNQQFVPPNAGEKLQWQIVP